MHKITGLESPVRPFPVAIVVSRFNHTVTERLRSGALKHLKQLGFSSEWITLVEVPGAVEIPLVVQRLAKKAKHEAIITLGAVIRGETSHYDYVCTQVSQGCQRVAMQYDLPVIFGVLTTENRSQLLPAKLRTRAPDAIPVGLGGCWPSAPLR